jgi:hypothetical protein
MRIIIKLEGGLVQRVILTPPGIKPKICEVHNYTLGDINAETDVIETDASGKAYKITWVRIEDET